MAGLEPLEISLSLLVKFCFHLKFHEHFEHGFDSIRARMAELEPLKISLFTLVDFHLRVNIHEPLEISLFLLCHFHISLFLNNEIVNKVKVSSSILNVF